MIFSSLAPHIVKPHKSQDEFNDAVTTYNSEFLDVGEILILDVRKSQNFEKIKLNLENISLINLNPKNITKKTPQDEILKNQSIDIETYQLGNNYFFR